MAAAIVSNSLRSRRQALGLTQQDVAKRSGLLQTNYSKIEQGKSDPRLRTLQEIARALSLEVMLIPAELLDTVDALTGQGPAPEEKPLFSVEPD
ncbi:MAG: helix-turn-helix transcriptional regulator [bacterium]|nr:helix-turn-helix transcriptional regulator [bacterium]